MTTVSITGENIVIAVDGAQVYPAAALPVDPPIEHPPVIPPAPGNPGAIQPPLNWPMGQASSDVLHIQPVADGAIICYEVPPLHNGRAVNFTQGQDANTKGGCVTEYSISQTPGVIISGAEGGPYYSSTGNIQKAGVTIDRSTGQMPYCPPGQVWYLNIRWKNPSGQPNGFSLQWAEAG